MKLEQSFEVAAPVERVWDALIDVEQVAPCLPGAAVSGRNEDGSFAGTFTVKIGPTSASYSGKLLMEQVDEGGHTATMQCNGTDKRGQGSAKATIVSTVAAVGENRTRVDVSTDYHITGRLARFGRGGMIEDISERLLREFAERLRATLEGSSGGQGADGGNAASSGGIETGYVASGEGGGAASASEPEPAITSEPGAASTSEPTGRIGGTPTEAIADTRVLPEPSPSEPVGGLSLVTSVLWQRFRHNPIPAAFIAGLLLALAVLGRRRSD
jgi:uncharacterized protein